MNKLDLQETKSGWDYQLYYQLYSPYNESLTSGHVDIKDLELAINKIDSIIFGNFDLGDVIFLQERNGNVENIIK